MCWAIMDWYSRRVLAWRISNSMDATFCVDCLDMLATWSNRYRVAQNDTDYKVGFRLVRELCPPRSHGGSEERTGGTRA